MTKRSCSYKEEGEELKGLVDLKKKAKMMKKVTTTIAALALTHKKRQRKVRPWGESTKKQMQAKTKSKTTRTCDDGEKVLFI
jgi:hypothetical protein